jgi:hypothetical protein
MTSVTLRDGAVTIESSKLDLYTKNFYIGMDQHPSRKVFNKFIVFADHYAQLDSKNKKIYDDIGTLFGAKLRVAQQSILAWYESLISDLTTPEELIEFVNLAEKCGNETIYTLACFALAQDLERLPTPEAIRERYGFENNLSPAEQDQLKKEDEIWNKIKDS